MTEREVLKLALEAFEEIAWSNSTDWQRDRAKVAITAIKEALAQQDVRDEIDRGAKILRETYLAQPEQEPVVWMYQDKSTHQVSFQKHMRAFVDHGATYETPLYTTPPQRKPLTDEELRAIENKINPNMRWRSSDEEGITFYQSEYYELIQAIEAAHGIKE